MAVEVLRPGTLGLPNGVTEHDVATMRNLMAQAFQGCQKTVASHRKTVVALHNLQKRAAANGLERFFNRAFVQLVNRVLPIKKGEPAAERVVKMIEAFVEMVAPADEADEEAEDTVATRFVENLIRHLLRGIDAKDRAVRFRCCQLIALTVNHLGELSDELFEKLKRTLYVRLHDKEQSIRLQAVLGLSQLQGAEDDDEVDENDPDADGSSRKTVGQMLMDTMEHDPSADVRRAALFNVEKTPDRYGALLDRAWDTHSTNRRVVYSRVMSQIGDFRYLTTSDRQLLLERGLKDRDSSVRTAAVRMFIDDWLPLAESNLLLIVERLDVLSSTIAETALMAFFEQREDTLAKIVFEPAFWTSLTVEAVCMARVYNAYCLKRGRQDLVESRMPELSGLASLMEYYFQRLDQDRSSETEYIVEQLLMIAETYDYSDEVGRRTTLALLRNVLIRQELNDVLIQRSVAVIKRLTVNERDFSQVILEVVTDVRDAAAEKQDQDQVHTIFAALKCLSLTQSMLELIENSFDSNVHLSSLLNSVILHAVASTSTDSVFERGILCLGLCCLLSRGLSRLYMASFCALARQDQEASIRILALKITTDLLVVHGAVLTAENNEGESSVDLMTVYRLYYRALRDPNEPELQSLAAESLSKLLLAGVFDEPELVQALVIVFFSADSVDNLSLRQALSFCIPVYCYSSSHNQERMASVAVAALKRVCTRYSAHDRMVTPTQMMQHLVDWTDPARVVGADPSHTTSSTHLNLGRSILERLSEPVDLKEERRALCVSLPKLSFPVEVSAETVSELQQLFEQVKALQDKPDVSSRTALARFETGLSRLAGGLTDKSAPASDTAAEPVQPEEPAGATRQENTATSRASSAVPLPANEERP